MAPGPILQIHRGHPPPHHHRTAIVETHNMKTLKPQNSLRSTATAPHKWKRTLKHKNLATKQAATGGPKSGRQWD